MKRLVLNEGMNVVKWLFIMKVFFQSEEYIVNCFPMRKALSKRLKIVVIKNYYIDECFDLFIFIINGL